MLHQLPKNVFSSRLVLTLAITTHPPRCCEDHARLVADKLANGKEPKEARRPAPHNRYRDGAPPPVLKVPSAALHEPGALERFLLDQPLANLLEKKLYISQVRATSKFSTAWHSRVAANPSSLV